MAIETGSVFVATMTGNAGSPGIRRGGSLGLSIIRALLSLAGFLIGAALGGKLGTMLASGRRRRLIIVAGTFEAFLIFAAAPGVDWVRSAGIRSG